MPSGSRSHARPVLTFQDLDRAAAAAPPIDDRFTQKIPLERIVDSTRNPRQDLGAIDELAASLEAHGLLQPVVVRPTDSGKTEGLVARAFELIAGHRRVAAARQLGWTEIEAVVRETEPDQAYILTLVENLQRDDLSAREEAAGLEVLLREHGWSTRQVADAVKRSQTFVSRRLRVFENPVLAPYVLAERLPVAVAEDLLPLKAARQRELADEAAAHGWTRAQLRKAMVGAPRAAPETRRRPGLTTRIQALTSELDDLGGADLVEADRAALRRLFRVIAELGRARTTRLARPVFPTIAPSGRAAFLDDAVAHDVEEGPRVTHYMQAESEVG